MFPITEVDVPVGPKLIHLKGVYYSRIIINKLKISAHIIIIRLMLCFAITII